MTAKLTRRSTTFRPTRVDIERLFGLPSGHNRTDVLSNECPGRQRPSERAPGKDRQMAFIRVEPVEVQVRTDWFSGRPTRDHLGRRASQHHPARRGPRGSGGIPGHQRPADVVRGGHAPRAPIADIHPSLAALDGHRPGRRGSSPGRLTLDQRIGAPEPGGRGAPAPGGRPSPWPPESWVSGRARRYRARPGSDGAVGTVAIRVQAPPKPSRNRTIGAWSHRPRPVFAT